MCAARGLDYIYAQVTPLLHVGCIGEMAADIEMLEALAMRVLTLGGRQRLDADGIAQRQFEADFSGICQKPLSFSHWALHSGSVAEITKNQRFPGDLPAGVQAGDKKPGITVDLQVPCRQCEACRAAHGKLWRDRARSEMRTATQRNCRNWFGTLTWSPQSHWAAECAIREKMDDPSPSDVAIRERRIRRMGAEATLMLKRIRKNSGVPIRYLLVTEEHKSGLPHIHILIHEVSDLAPLRKSVLDAAWRGGFCQWRLAKGVTAAFYVSKYISKSLGGRVRASAGYGNDENPL
jgi:hypothetical protein